MIMYVRLWITRGVSDENIISIVRNFINVIDTYIHNIHICIYPQALATLQCFRLYTTCLSCCYRKPSKSFYMTCHLYSEGDYFSALQQKVTTS